MTSPHHRSDCLLEITTILMPKQSSGKKKYKKKNRATQLLTIHLPDNYFAVNTVRKFDFGLQRICCFFLEEKRIGQKLRG
jgi:hypothetical protein